MKKAACVCTLPLLSNSVKQLFFRFVIFFYVLFLCCISHVQKTPYFFHFWLFPNPPSIIFWSLHPFDADGPDCSKKSPDPKVHNICTQKKIQIEIFFQLYYTIVWWVWLVTRQTMIIDLLKTNSKMIHNDDKNWSMMFCVHTRPKKIKMMPKK